MPTYEEQVAAHLDRAKLLSRITKLEASIEKTKTITTINLYVPGEGDPCAGCSHFPAYGRPYEGPELSPTQLASIEYIATLVRIKSSRLESMKEAFANWVA